MTNHAPYRSTILDEADKGRRVELVHTDDPYTKLKPGDKGTYLFLLKQTDPEQNEHHIEWDSGSKLSMIPGLGDRFKFVEESDFCSKGFTVSNALTECPKRIELEEEGEGCEKCRYYREVTEIQRLQ